MASRKESKSRSGCKVVVFHKGRKAIPVKLCRSHAGFTKSPANRHMHKQLAKNQCRKGTGKSFKARQFVACK